MRSTSKRSRRKSYPLHLERRNTLRISEPYPIRVRGTNTAGYAFDEESSLSNLSAGGLYLMMTHRVDVGTPLFALMRLSTSSFANAAPCVAARGTVLRVDRCPGDTYGIAMKFSHHRFL